MTSKAEYVRSQGQTRDHHCHWPGCDKQVPPAMWGCKQHWFTLPAGLRAKVWATYRPGQEVNMTPSAAYLKVADEVQAWVRDRARTLAGNGADNASPRSDEKTPAPAVLPGKRHDLS